MQRRARYARLPEFGGDHDVTQEPLEESAFRTHASLSKRLRSLAGSPCSPQPRPEDVGALNDALGEGRGDTRWRRPDTPTLAPEVRVPIHLGTRLWLPDKREKPPAHAGRIASVALQDPLLAEGAEELHDGVGQQDRQIPPRRVGDQISDEEGDLHRVEGVPHPRIEPRGP